VDADGNHDGLPDWWERLHGTNPCSPPRDFSFWSCIDRPASGLLDSGVRIMLRHHESGDCARAPGRSKISG
jgi:hypothetical protein